MKAATSEEKFRLELAGRQTRAGGRLAVSSSSSSSSSSSCHVSRFTAACETEVGGLRTALDPDISDQDQPEVLALRGGGRVRPLVCRGGEETAGRESPPGGRGGADLLGVEAGVSVEGLLLHQTRHFLPPLAHSPGLRLAEVTEESDFWRGWLDEDRDSYLVAGLDVGAHGDGAGGGDVAFKVVVRKVSWEVPGSAELSDSGDGQIVGVSSRLPRQLLLPHARQLEGDLLLVYGEGPDGALLGESSLVLQSAAAKQVRD